MKVILIKKVKGLGDEWETIEASPGYFKNYLSPQKLAVIPNANLLKRASEEQERRKLLTAKKQEEYQKIAEQINGKEIEISAKVTKTGKLYGSITPKNIAESLSKKVGFDVPEEFIKTQPIKNVGDFEIEIAFGEFDITSKIKVKIKPKLQASSAKHQASNNK